MKRQPTKAAGNSYKILYWMGGALLVLLIGVTALIAFTSKDRNKVAPDPERTVLWLYDAADPKGPAAVAVIEESRSQARLVAVPFPAPDEARKAYNGKSSKKAQEALSSMLGRQIHYRVFMPYSVVATLIDAAGGIQVSGRKLTGADALAYIKEGGEHGAVRSTEVMLALARAVSENGISMTTSEGLRLARDVDTNMDLLAFPDVLARWSEYVTPRVERPAGADPAALQKLLLPDASPAR